MEGIVIFARKNDSCSLVGHWLFGCCRARTRQSNVSKIAYGWRWIWSCFLKWVRRTCSWNAWYATKGSGAVQLHPWTMWNRTPDHLPQITWLQICEYMIYFQFYCVILEGVLILILLLCDNGRLMNIRRWGRGNRENINAMKLVSRWHIHFQFNLAWYLTRDVCVGMVGLRMQDSGEGDIKRTSMSASQIM